MARVVRMLSFILAVVVLVSVPVCAAENVDQRASNYFAAYSVYLHKTSSSQFQVWFEVTAVGTM